MAPHQHSASSAIRSITQWSIDSSTHLHKTAQLLAATYSIPSFQWFDSTRWNNPAIGLWGRSFSAAWNGYVATPWSSWPHHQKLAGSSEGNIKILITREKDSHYARWYLLFNTFVKILCSKQQVHVNFWTLPPSYMRQIPMFFTTRSDFLNSETCFCTIHQCFHPEKDVKSLKRILKHGGGVLMIKNLPPPTFLRKMINSLSLSESIVRKVSL